MRKCLRCNAEMVEDLELKLKGGVYYIEVTEQGKFQKNLGVVKSAVCPECGYTETYVEDTEKVKKLVRKDK